MGSPKTQRQKLKTPRSQRPQNPTPVDENKRKRFSKKILEIRSWQRIISIVTTTHSNISYNNVSGHNPTALSFSVWGASSNDDAMRCVFIPPPTSFGEALTVPVDFIWDCIVENWRIAE
ncbi:hypothetical protein JTE90_028086 [Oedothorax gibbosus]|uniref:Uncharacterized protein n=1 Tax=Oedothorax gibbosus TaxID=931172 RepID=A0AAV6VB84_9ARAC|nr:hypothetical protein JTE90_028086 [Oedothorax gibbosus]